MISIHKLINITIALYCENLLSTNKTDSFQDHYKLYPLLIYLSSIFSV